MSTQNLAYAHHLNKKAEKSDKIICHKD